MKQSVTARVIEITRNPSTSFWLKDALHSMRMRDPVDFYNDVLALQELAHDRLVELGVIEHIDIQPPSDDDIPAFLRKQGE